MRKKTPTNANAAGAGVYLDDDEQLVEEVTTTKKIGRQRRETPAEEVDAEPVTDAEADFPDDEEAGGDFSQTSIAALIYDEGSEPFEDQLCSVVIKRKPDGMKDRFVNPCNAYLSFPSLQNIPITTEQSEIEEEIRRQYGGGHYVFQIRFGDRLSRSWRQSLADLPEQVAAAKSELTPATTPQPVAPPPVDPLDNFLANAEKMKALKGVLFGDEETRMKEEIERLRHEIATRPVEPAAPQSESLVILEKALAAGNPDLTERLLDYAFPTKDENSRHWIADIVSVAIENKDAILGFVGPLLTGQPAAPQQPPSIEAMLRATPPAQIPTNAEPPRSAFRRGNTEPETTADDNDLIRDAEEVTDDEPNDAGGNTAEQTSEGTENADAAS